MRKNNKPVGAHKLPMSQKARKRFSVYAALVLVLTMMVAAPMTAYAADDPIINHSYTGTNTIQEVYEDFLKRAITNC